MAYGDFSTPALDTASGNSAVRRAPHGRIPTVGVRFATFDCLPVGKRLAVRSVSDHIARIDSAAGAVVAVVPAKVIKQVSAAQIEANLHNAAHYVEHGRVHAAQCKMD